MGGCLSSGTEGGGEGVGVGREFRYYIIHFLGHVGAHVVSAPHPPFQVPGYETNKMPG